MKNSILIFNGTKNVIIRQSWIVAILFFMTAGLTYAQNSVYESPVSASNIATYLDLAKLGNAEAQFLLGNYYFDKGSNYTEAVKWYRQAAEQGHVVAQNNLGECYIKGQGVVKNTTEGITWWEKAAEQGYSGAMVNLGSIYMQMNNQIEGVKWYRKAAEQNDYWGQYSLGFCYEFARGVAQNYAEAMKWYQKAAEQGNSYAQYRLGYCYEYHSTGGEKNLTEAISWYLEAAEQGNDDAKNALKRMKINIKFPKKKK